MRKKGLSGFLSMVLAAALTIGLLGQQTAVFAAESGSVGHQEFSMLGAGTVTTSLADGVLTIEGSGTLEKADLSGYDGEIANITAVTIGAGITEIGAGVFENYTALKQVTLPYSLDNIGERAFAACEELEEINLSTVYLQSIGKGAFWGTEWARQQNGFVISGSTLYDYVGDAASVTVPDGVLTIGEGAFRSNAVITSVTLPEGVTTIRKEAFSDCGSLQTIRVPDSLQKIDGTAFAGVPLVERPDGFRVVDGILYDYVGNVTELILPDGIKRICESTFAHRQITGVRIPEGVKLIDKEAFYFCSELRQVEIPATLVGIGQGAFEGCTSLASIELPAGVTEIGMNAFWLCNSLESIEIPAGVTEIGIGVFGRCSSLRNVSLHSGLKKIEEGAFMYCASLTDITIPGTVEAIGDRAFYQCEVLEAVNFENENNLGQIGERAFWGTKWQDQPGTVKVNNVLLRYNGDDKTITVPGSVSRIAYMAFAQRTALESVIIEDGVKRIDDYAFVATPKLRNITVPKSVAEVGEKAIGWGENQKADPLPVIRCYRDSAAHQYAQTNRIPAQMLDDVDDVPDTGIRTALNAGILTIEGSGTVNPADLFQYEGQKANITAVVIKEGITGIAYSAFKDYTALNEVSIPASVTYIGKDAFLGTAWANRKGGFVAVNGILYDYVGSATELILPNGISEIAYGAFSGNKTITKVILPDGVKTIGDGAFGYCDNLKSVSIPASVTEIGNNAFVVCKNLGDIVFLDKNTLKTIGYDAFYGTKWAKDQGDYVTLNHRLLGYQGNGTALLLPDDIVEVNQQALAGTRAESIRFNTNLRKIGDRGVELNDSLKAVTIPGNVSEIAYMAFARCTALESVVIESGVQSIGEGAFCGNPKLMNIWIPKSVTEIGARAFGYQYSGWNKVPYVPTVHCYLNSAAHKYARENGLLIDLLDETTEIKVSNITLDCINTTMQQWSSMTLNATPYPYNATNKVLRWSTSNSNVVTVNAYGTVTAVGVGTATVTATSTDGGWVSASCVITVKSRTDATVKVERITLNRTSLALVEGQFQWLQADVSPSWAENRTLRWASSNPAVATVSAYGMVTAVGAGTTTVTASSTDGSWISAYCVITVVSKNNSVIGVEKITLNKTSATLDEGQTLWLQASVLPVGATNRTLSWSSSNPAIATVSAYGTVTAGHAGTARITASSTDGSGVSASCVVTVRTPGTNVTPSPGQSADPLYYTVWFDANGGTKLSRTNMTLLNNDRLGVLPTVQRKGYAFSGWYTLPAGGTQVTSNTILSGTTTVYAQWDKLSGPGKVKKLSLGTGKTKALGVSFKKVAGASGYQIVYSTDKDFKASETKMVSTQSVKGALKNLNKGKTYYVKVRAYEKDSAGERVYGPYSAVKKAKVK